MVDSDDAPYVEEEDVGFDLVPALFDPSNRKFCTISSKNVFSYDVESGKRLKMFRHSDFVIGAHYIRKKLMTITNRGTITEWDFESGTELSKRVIMSDVDFLWSYELKNEESDTQIYIFGQKIMLSNGDCESIDVDESSSDISFTHSTSLFHLQFNENDWNAVPKLKRLVDIADRVNSRAQLAVSSDLAVVVNGRELKILPFFPNRHQINGPLSFSHRTKLSTLDNDCIAFNEVNVVGDSVYASLNIGRLYFWSRVRETGLDHNNKTFINVRHCAFTSVISKHRTLYTGDGECTIAKWNLATSGVGRWHRAEYLDIEAPVERLLLSDDATYLLAHLADNSLYVVKTASMTIQSQAQVINWNSTALPADWTKLVVDPAHPDYIVTNGRLGHIQWIDPSKWRTIASYDVCEENPPPRDHFNLPNYLWLNVYLVHFTATRFVICECRRNDPNRTYLKIYQRITNGSITDFRLEECVIYPKKVAFIRSSYDELVGNKQPNEKSAMNEEFLRIDCDGQLDVFVPDSHRLGRWRVDENRSEVIWHKSVVLSCSRVRHHAFATVNEVYLKTEKKGEIQKRSFVLLWRLPVALQLFQFVDCVMDAKQVEWASPNTEGKSVLLISSGSGICGYNPEVASVLWTVDQPGFNLFSSLLTYFAYDAKRIVWFDATTGKLKKIQAFSCPQQQIIATGNLAGGNIRISGLADRSLSILKRDVAENAVLSDISLGAKKKTPFSELLAKSVNGFISPDVTAPKKSRLDLQTKAPQASKIFDGPAYSLPFMTEIAPKFIRACMLPKRKDD